VKTIDFSDSAWYTSKVEEIFGHPKISKHIENQIAKGKKMEDVEMKMWVSPKVTVKVKMGMFSFNMYIDQLIEVPSGVSPSTGNGSTNYRLAINLVEHKFEADNDADAIAKGFAMLGIVLKERMDKFDGDPTALPVFSGGEDDPD
jgi:hypothetical protein